ncbi:hypothetical protein HNP84_003052 [Thermocatellispora tengchongensis]|uniref:Secreted protein n=1 Tax=Thermocatellispora tengchongensis TaxID=1073253 RepID=A0A840P490_9ACTN|nr:hypothetical protein [Thermocatellispora tengchongensis]MBB5133326.1 hypothetical protein [Thermocatellispora tengchongensis]
MKTSRILTGLALAAAFVTLAPAAAMAATASGPGGFADLSWGPYYSAGKYAKAGGTLSVHGEDDADIPSADKVKVSGKLYDLTSRRVNTCGWAVFRVSYLKDPATVKLRQHAFRNCDPKNWAGFSFTGKDVYQVEFKICAEPKASKPSFACLYQGTWKTLYLAK